MNHAVFLDSSIFVAFLNSRDRWHAQAVTLFASRKPDWATSVLVFSETYAWFLHKMGEEPARTFRTMVENLEGLKVLDVLHKDHKRIAKMLDQYRGSKLTYVDASSLVLAERHKIRQVWSTDHDLSITGLEILPRV